MDHLAHGSDREPHPERLCPGRDVNAGVAVVPGWGETAVADRTALVVEQKNVRREQRSNLSVVGRQRLTGQIMWLTLPFAVVSEDASIPGLYRCARLRDQ